MDTPSPYRDKTPPLRRIARRTRIVLGLAALILALPAASYTGTWTTAFWFGLIGIILLYDVVSELLGRGWPVGTLEAHHRQLARETVAMATISVGFAILALLIVVGVVEPGDGPRGLVAGLSLLASWLFGRLVYRGFRDIRRERAELARASDPEVRSQDEGRL